MGIPEAIVFANNSGKKIIKFIMDFKEKIFLSPNSRQKAKHSILQAYNRMDKDVLKTCRLQQIIKKASLLNAHPREPPINISKTRCSSFS